MAKPRKLTPEQHKELARRNFLYMQLRLEAAKHSKHQLAREFGVNVTTIDNYLNRATQ